VIRETAEPTVALRGRAGKIVQVARQPLGCRSAYDKANVAPIEGDCQPNARGSGGERQPVQRRE
jgi:hypothetical protein